MYYGMIPVQYVQYPQVNNNGWQYPNHFNHQPETLPRNAKMKPADGHTHAHYGATSCMEDHTHLHPGVTSRPIETKEGHVHEIYGNTTFEDGHIHEYNTRTGPPIELTNGYHTHYVEIKTTKNDGHTHMIKGFIAASKS
jgi:hypothetical protein